MNPGIERNRAIRQAILRVLHVHYSAGLNIGYTAESFRTLEEQSVFGPGAEDITVCLRELLELELIRVVAGTGAHGSPARFALTVKGADFCRASFPWAAIDPFTGSARA